MSNITVRLVRVTTRARSHTHHSKKNKSKIKKVNQSKTKGETIVRTILLASSYSTTIRRYDDDTITNQQAKLRYEQKDSNLKKKVEKKRSRLTINSILLFKKKEYSKMGGMTAKKKGIRSKKKEYKRKVWLCNREKDIDQIQDEFEKIVEKHQQKPTDQQQDNDNNNVPIADNTVINPSLIMIQNQPIDDELPGMGQFYCPETDRYFISEKALSDHKRTKYYKKRCHRIQNEPKYTKNVAEWGAGKTKEILPPITKK